MKLTARTPAKNSSSGANKYADFIKRLKDSKPNSRTSKSRSVGSKKQLSRLEMAAQNSPKAKSRLMMMTRQHRMSQATKQKIKKVLLLLLGLFLIGGVIGGLWFASYLQRLDSELPSVDEPFREKEIASVIYDRKGTELYKLFNNFNRDPVNIKDIPPLVRWAFLAAEDIDFYSHKGFDPAGILRCGFAYVRGGGVVCGGSTITQQLVKITTNQSQLALERKLKELLMALKVEQAYSKDQILQMYLTVTPYGSNIYGLTAASDFYFHKKPKDLSLAEAAILASIIQDPVSLSPTLGSNTVKSQELVKQRQEYVLGQMLAHKDQINAQNRVNLDDPEADDLVTDDLIEAAKKEELKYQPPIATDKKAGHMVDFVVQELQKKNYKNGTEPFTPSELQTGGYRIYTTLDYDLQQVAERYVADAAKTYGATYNYSNDAVITIQPSTGQILTMAGSKSYTGTSEPAGCKGNQCRYAPQVNVLLTPQSPGSSTKPFATYEAYREGKLFTGSLLPDVPIDVGGGYKLKNWNGTFFGVTPKTYAGEMLRESRNMPALVVLEMIGIPKFLETMRTFGYTTYTDASQYGPSVVLGGADVLPLEHAQGYDVFANGGDLVKYEGILKIEDKNGNVIYQAQPARTKVADERAVYMLNESLLNNHSVSWDGRDVSSKSGTSENSTDAWISMWSPDFVTIGWVGNNNNQTMNLNAFGENAVVPWLKNYMRQIGDAEYFSARTAFPRPAGIVEGGGCIGDCTGAMVGLARGYMLQGVTYPADNIHKKIRVCVDQPYRLARPIDEIAGKAVDAQAITYIMPAPSYQKFLDDYLQNQANQNKGMPNGGPTLYCDVDRSGSGINGPFFLNPAASINGNQIRFTGTASSSNGSGVTNVDFYFNCNESTVTCTAANKLGNQAPTNGAIDATFNLPAGTPVGSYQVIMKATDATATPTTAFSAPLTVTVPAASFNFSVSPSKPLYQWGPGGDVGVGSGNSLDFTFTFTAATTIANPKLYMKLNGGAGVLVGNMSVGGGGTTYTFNNWGATIPNPGTGKTDNYTFYIVGSGGGTNSFTSNVSSAIPVKGV
jgi:penicillin-binding protein 1A